jgi:hypothetical protein
MSHLFGKMTWAGSGNGETGIEIHNTTHRDKETHGV